MNKFKVIGAFSTPMGGEKRNIIYGEIISGEVNIGMQLWLPNEGADTTNINIIGVEFVDMYIDGEMMGYISLVLDSNNLSNLESLCGQEIDIKLKG